MFTNKFLVEQKTLYSQIHFIPITQDQSLLLEQIRKNNCFLSTADPANIYLFKVNNKTLEIGEKYF